MCGSDDRSQIVGVLHAIEDYDQLCALDDILQLDLATDSTKSNHALMRNAFAGAVQQLARLKVHRHCTFAAKVDNLLDPGARGSFRNEHFIERTPSAERFSNRVNAGGHAHLL
jgi:hypothetical protein